jgi:hypothetical protein
MSSTRCANVISSNKKIIDKSIIKNWFVVSWNFFVRIRITRIKWFTGCYLIIVGENLGMILFILIWLTPRTLSDNYNINHQQTNEQLHPVHPQILDILIQTKNPCSSLNQWSKIGDSEVIRRNRSFYVRNELSDSEALLQAVRCLGMLWCDSEALRRNRIINEINLLKCATIYLVIFRIRIDCDYISQHQQSLTKRGVETWQSG